MLKKRSVGVTFYTIVILIFVIIGTTQLNYEILINLFTVGLHGQDKKIMEEALFNKLYPNPTMVYARFIGSIIGGFFLFIILLGLYKMKNWARILYIGVGIFSLIIHCFLLPGIIKSMHSIFSKGYYYFGPFLCIAGLIISILYAISIIYFFTRPNVKAQFL